VNGSKKDVPTHQQEKLHVLRRLDHLLLLYVLRAKCIVVAMKKISDMRNDQTHATGSLCERNNECNKLVACGIPVLRVSRRSETD
jgi:hypothetical protein